MKEINRPKYIQLLNEVYQFFVLFFCLNKLLRDSALTICKKSFFVAWDTDIF